MSVLGCDPDVFILNSNEYLSLNCSNSRPDQIFAVVTSDPHFFLELPGRLCVSERAPNPPIFICAMCDLGGEDVCPQGQYSARSCAVFFLSRRGI